MIKQHYYTRAKSGVYSDTPGYDTVAKSMGLSDDFIKEVLHNYCFYEIPSELLNEENADKFPKAYTVFNVPSGEMVIGRTSYVPKDFEGKRSTFFTHNYILDKKQKEEFIKDYNNIIFADGFKNKFEAGDSSIIEDVKKIEMESSEMGFSSLEELLSELKISTNTFEEIVMACFLSVLQNRKLYIILDVNISMLSFYAKELLKFIYKVLPYAVREKLGFITYTKDYKSKDFIHIEFIPKDGIKSINTEINAGYLFDFHGKRVLKEGIDIENHEYLKFIIKNIDNEKEINTFIEEVSNFCTESLNIKDYDDFCKMLLAGDEIYKEDKIGLFDDISKDEQLLAEFVKRNRDNESLKAYTAYLIEKCADFDEYFQIVEFCLIISPRFIYGVKEELKEKVLKLFKPSFYMADDFIFIDEKISLLLEKHKEQELKNFLQQILEALFDVLVEEIKPEFMSAVSIQKINLPQRNEDSENYEIISILKKVVAIKNFEDAKEAGLAIENSSCKAKVEAAIAKLYKLSINDENYLKIICAFLNNTGCNINELIKYVWENGETKESREFIVWLCCMYEKLFSKEAMKDLKQALLNYFDNMDTDFFEDTEFRERIIKESKRSIKSFIINQDKKRAKGIRRLKLMLGKMFSK